MTSMSEPARRRVVGTISIGEVLTLVKREFPDITISKIRFLESEGLIAPERTASGYRRFAERDIENLRSVLILQRDQYLPLKVIREQLEDSAAEAIGVPVAGDGQRADDFRAGAGKVRLSLEELGIEVGLTGETLGQLVEMGIILSTPTGHFDESALAIAQIVSRLTPMGVEPRHLRPFRVVADRDSGLVEQIITPFRHPRDNDEREHTRDLMREAAALLVQLHGALLRAELIRSQMS